MCACGAWFTVGSLYMSIPNVQHFWKILSLNKWPLRYWEIRGLTFLHALQAHALTALVLSNFTRMFVEQTTLEDRVAPSGAERFVYFPGDKIMSLSAGQSADLLTVHFKRLGSLDVTQNSCMTHLASSPCDAGSVGNGLEHTAQALNALWVIRSFVSGPGVCVFRKHLWNCSKLIKIKTKFSLFIKLLLWWSFKILQFFTTPFISHTLTFRIPNWPTSHSFLVSSLHLTLDCFSPPLSLWAAPWGDVLSDLQIHSFSLQLRASLYFTNLLSFYFWWFYSFSCNSIRYLFKSSWTFLMVSYSRLDFFLYVLPVHLFYIQNQHSSDLIARGT